MGKTRRKVCGTCGRIRRRDLDRNYCPITAYNIRYNKPADKCRFYIDQSEAEADSYSEEDEYVS